MMRTMEQYVDSMFEHIKEDKRLKQRKAICLFILTELENLILGLDQESFSKADVRAKAHPVISDMAIDLVILGMRMQNKITHFLGINNQGKFENMYCISAHVGGSK